MKKYKAAIFDLDGVIVDTAKYHYKAWKDIFNKMGIDFSKEDNEHLKGVGRMKCIEIIESLKGVTYTDEERISIAERKNNIYKEYINDLTQDDMLKGAKEYLSKLKENNIPIALGSASKNARLILEKLQIIDLFDVIVDGTIISKAKPDPEVFATGAKLLNIPCEDVVVFEDAYAGVEAGKNANMYVIGIGDKKILNKADKVIKGLYEADLTIFE